MFAQKILLAILFSSISCSVFALQAQAVAVPAAQYTNSAGELNSSGGVNLNTSGKKLVGPGTGSAGRYEAVPERNRQMQRGGDEVLRVRSAPAAATVTNYQ